MYDRLTKIDELTRPDHTFLEASDSCFFLGEYTARGGYAASATNDLINNLKKPMTYRLKAAVWQYKERAINTCAQALRNVLGKNGIEGLTFVPVPPSKAKTDPSYDDRLTLILQKMGQGFDADVRELVVQHANMLASHEGERASIAELVANYSIVDALRLPPPKDHFVIFDDVLTTGRHYKAMQQVLAAAYPTATFRGLFVARRLPKAPAEEFGQ